MATTPPLASFPAGSSAVVIGSSGGVGSALADLIEASGRFGRTFRLSRGGPVELDLTDEASIERAATTVREEGPVPTLIINATGFLHGEGIMPEKSLSRLTPEGLHRNFAINAIGPALVLKHFVPLLPREGRSVFAALTAKVGSISDNSLGGWYSYRAAKAAHNQLIRTAAIETARRKEEAVLVALHPGTVKSALSDPFAKAGLNVRDASEAAGDLLRVIDGLSPADNGTFHSYDGEKLPW